MLGASSNRLNHRLPTEILPIQYDVKLEPNLFSKKFSGSVVVRFELRASLGYLPIHVNALNVVTDGVNLLYSNGAIKKNISRFHTYLYPKFDYFVTEFSSPLKAGIYMVKYRFQGYLDNQQIGLFITKYFNEGSNNSHLFVTSKFQPIFARMAFPCFDEPHLKAKFLMTIIYEYENGFNALSNMNVVSFNVQGSKMEARFAESPPMSTYMTCFFISDFIWESRVVKSLLKNVPDFEICFFAQPSEIKNIDHAIKAAVELIQYFIKYFGMPYPLPKLDMVAVPEYAAMAMEHWGLILFNAKMVLYDQEKNTCANKQRVVTLIANQIAHMWMGNLVTVKWWSDLWLTEGFVNYIEYKIVDDVYPDLGVMDQFLLLELYPVMELDARLLAHSLERKVDNTRQIYEVFDKISYSKSAALIRWLDSLMERGALQTAVRKYLKNSAYKNTNCQNFFGELEIREGFLPLGKFLDGFLRQPGFPLITVVKIRPNTYRLTQTCFPGNSERYDGQMYGSILQLIWTIPITYFTSADKNVQSFIFNRTDNDVVIVLPQLQPVEWIKFNIDHLGYYRVNYSIELWQHLTMALFKNPIQFSTSDRAQLLSDAFNMANVRLISYEIPLEMASYLGREFEFVPWYVALGYFKNLNELLRGTTLQDDFMIYVRQLLLQLYSLVTWDVELNHIQSLLRISILEAACEFKLPAALSEVKRRFKAWIEMPASKIHPDLRGIVYYYGIQEVDTPANWQLVWDYFIDETNIQEKQKLLRCLAATKNKDLLKKLINIVWKDKNLHGDTFLQCLYFISSNPIGRDIVWDYVRDQWTHLIKRFGDNSAALSRLIPNITEYFKTALELEDIWFFFNKYPRGGISHSARAEAYEKVTQNIYWLEVHLPEIATFFMEQKETGSFHSCMEFIHAVA